MLIQDENDSNQLEKVELEDQEHSYIKLSKTKMALLLIGLSFSIFISVLDSAILATSMVSILDDFGTKDKLTWIAASYLLTETAFMPLYGKFSDIFGRKATMLLALAIFLIGSILSGTSTNIDMLIAFRAVSGIGGAGLISLSIIIIADVTPVRKRGLVMAVIEAMYGLSSVAGPLLGGFFASKLSWRWSFYINIPISAIAIVVVYFVLDLPVNKEKLMYKLKRIDIIGSLTLVISIGLLVLGINWGGNEYPWVSVPVLVSLILSLIIFLLFVFNEVKLSSEPIIPLRIFNRNTILISTIAFFNGCIMFVSIIYIPMFFQEIQKDSPMISGLQLTPFLLGIVIFSLCSGLFIAKTGTFRTLLICGTLIQTISLSLYGLFDQNTPILQGVLNAFIGLGVGLSIQTCPISAQASSKKEDTAIISSLITFLLSMGGVFGLAIQGAVFTNSLKYFLSQKVANVNFNNMPTDDIIKILNSETDYNDCYTKSMRILFLSMIAYSSISFVCSLLVKHVSLKPPIKEANTDI